jgi:beta-phosphoglucomutase family hydrolase
VQFKAVILDLDGVITRTADLHARAWKQMFDDFLRQRAQKSNTDFAPFTDADYLTFVDGMPRYDGVRCFLESRGVDLDSGDPADSPEKTTMCGLGNRKNKLFNKLLKQGGVEVFNTTVALINELKKSGIRVGVASSSKNCGPVLESAGLEDLFEVRIDGVVSAELNLAGKPAPDIFLTACQRLGVCPMQAVVVEDAVSGVQAGRDGGFGMVIGVARQTDPSVLLQNGADLVVSDMGEITADDINNWFKTGLEHDQWSATFHDYDPALEKTRETLLTVGNGYLGTRGAMEEASAGPVNYPGTYLAGVFNRLTSRASGKDIENEDFVNCPNWLPINFCIGSGPWMDINKAEINSICRSLDFKTGIVHRDMTVSDAAGRKTRIVSERLASMADPHICAMRYSLTPLNYYEDITFSAAINGDIINDGVERYRDLNQQHLKPVTQKAQNADLLVHVKTTQSNIEIAAAAKIFIKGPEKKPTLHFAKNAKAEIRFSLAGKKGQPLELEKIAAIFTSADTKQKNPADQALKAISGQEGYDKIKAASIWKWAELWEEMDIKVCGDRFSQKMLRLHMYHLLVTASPHNKNLDAGMPARGLHGEAYRGHIFWDELFVMPFYDLHFPEIAKSLLMYRYHRLDEARQYARQNKHKGAMFPWQSGSTGREETQVLHLNPMTGHWGPDHSRLQRHVSLAVAFNIWQYFHITGDLDFLENFGAEMFFEICRFWADMAGFDQKTGRFHISGVMGPDEFHEKYPDSENGGLKDNAYTNLMVNWAFTHAGRIWDLLTKPARNALADKIGLSGKEPAGWQHIADNLNIVIHDGLIAQFDGYFSLDELDWAKYREKYDDIHRMDRILKKENKNPDAYKAAKQADVLMAFFNLGEEEIKKMLKSMGYDPAADLLEKNFSYYIARTSHGSTLSRVVHAAIAELLGQRQTGWQFYRQALSSDYIDIQGGTTAEGIHTGVMASTVLMAISAYAGLKVRQNILALSPNLPETWEKIIFGIWFKKIRYEFEITGNEVILKTEGPENKSIEIDIMGKTYQIPCGEKISVSF